MEKVKDCSTALRVIENEFLSPEINTVLSLPIIAIRMTICEDMSEHLHLDVTGK
jgi:hypothetical protein